MSPQLPSLSATLDAHLPVLLLPVGVQVKFVHTPAQPASGAGAAQPEKYELWVRIYPDQLGISTHQEALTAAEQAAGQQYWAATPDPSQHDADRWRGLVGRFGVPRATWILRQTTAAGLVAGAPAPAAANWTAPAQALGLPDRFTVLLYTPTPQPGAADTPATTSPAGQLLFGAASSAAYDPALVPTPTTEFLTLRKTATGNPLGPGSLAVGLHPDPSATTPADVLGVDAGNLWTVDFDEAVRVGMAVRIAFDTKQDYDAGFARLLVVGVRQATPAASQQALETLLSHHYYTDGLQLVAQGTPTNNTDAVAAGYSARARADADAALPLLTQPVSYDPALPRAARPDGQHLAAALGLSVARPPALGAGRPPVPALAGAQAHDVGEAQLMNQALWPATYGYFLEEMLAPLLSADDLDWTRTLFEDYVLARGPVPALRVGAQPYGVLPTTHFSAWQPDTSAAVPAAEAARAAKLQAVLRQLDAVWTERLNPQPDLYPPSVRAGATAAGFVPPPAEAANLLTTLSLDATSTEYYQRYLLGPVMAEALNNHATAADNGTADQQAIWAAAASTGGHYQATQDPVYQEFARTLDPAGTLLGLPAGAPPIFGKVFQSAVMKLADAFADEPAARRQEGVLLDDQPLSETACLTGFVAVTGAAQALTGNPDRPFNYVDWLATADFDALRREDFTAIIDTNNTGNLALPGSLFYVLLRQAVLQAYWAAAQRYYAADTNRQGQAPTPTQRRDTELFNVLTTGDKPRWSWLYDQVSAAKGNQRVHEYVRAHDAPLATYLAAVRQLAALPTARLERLLAEHLDLGSYRLDAWRLAPVAERLHQLRSTTPQSPGGDYGQGSHLGAFGWLENGRPADAATPGADGLLADPDSLGYLLTPSLPHGTAAAILRQGYKSRQHTADPQDPAADRMAVDISSRRVRAALALLEGLRGGASLGALLGQRLERALTQAPGLANGRPYAYYIQALRQAFPLANEYALPADATGATAPGLAPEQGQRQVLDGAALLRAAAQHPAYPYGLALGPPAGSDFARFLTEQVAQLADELDALGDVGVGEGIYQAARGNTDRAGAVLESLAQGQFPVQPDSVQPAPRGFTLTQRLLVQLPPASTLAGWPAALAGGAARTPRAAAAPRLNAWLGQFFPDPATLSFALAYQPAEGGHPVALATPAPTLYQAGLHPLDLLYLLDEASLQAGSDLDRLLRYAYAPLVPAGAVPAGASLALDYGAGTAPAALRRLLPLLARLRPLLAGARPASPLDLQAPGRVADPEAEAPHPALSQALAAARQALAGLLPATSAALTPAQLYQLALYGLPEAAAALAPGLSPAAQATASSVAYQAAQARLAATSVAPAGLAAELARAAALFGAAFRPDVAFTLGNAASPADPQDPANALRDAYAAALDPAAAARLLRTYPDASLALQEWLHGLATVREPATELDRVLLLRGLLDPATELAPLPLQVAQFVTTPGQAPDTKGDYWLGLPWDTTPYYDAQQRPLPAYAPPGDALALVQWLPAAYAPTAEQAALWLDEWVETLPQPTQPTALTFHFDQPNSEAPQTLLLVVPPTAPGQLPAGAAWQLQTLAGALNETLDLAKKRTVEPDALAFTPLAAVLPAVVAPVAQQAVTLTLDLGRVNGTARFDEEVLAP